MGWQKGQDCKVVTLGRTCDRVQLIKKVCLTAIQPKQQVIQQANATAAEQTLQTGLGEFEKNKDYGPFQ